MSKTKPEIAKAILERRNRMTHVVIPGDIHEAIGADGVAEALKERWLVPDTDSGYLCVTNDLVKIEEMRTLAEMKPEQYAPEAVSVTESHEVSLFHTKRRLHEIAAPGTGHPAPGLTTLGQPPVAPQAPAAPQGQTDDGFPIGTPVTISRQGRSANGMIEKLLPDGRYKLGFGADQGGRPPGDDIFSKDEMTVVPNNPQRTAVTA